MSGKGLTPRELEVARLIVRGLTNREIADVLVVSPETVKTHVAHILRKLDLRSRHQVAAWYRDLHLKSPGGGLNRPDEDRHSPGRWRGRAGRPTTANVSRGVPVGGAIGKGRWIGWPVAAGLALLVVAGAGFAVAGANGDRHGEGAAARSPAEVAETPAPKLLMNVYLPRDPEPEPWGLDARPVEAPEWGAIPPGDLDMLRQRASPEELALISDGVITRDEFLGAFMAAHACSVEAAEAIGGVVVHDPNLTGVDPQFGGMHSDNPAAFSKAGEAHMDCVETYFNEVVAAWGIATSAAVNQRLMDAIGLCLVARGYTVPGGANRRELAEAVGQPGDDISDFYACEEQASRSAAGAG